MKHFMSRSFVGVLILAASGCAMSEGVDPAELSAGESSDEAQKQQHLYYNPSVTWSSPSISVCWANSGSSTERGWVQDAVEAAIEPFSDVDFTGWGLCNGGSAEVVITHATNEWPRAALGERSASTTTNMWLNPFTGSPQNLDGSGGNDFVGCWQTSDAGGAAAYTGDTGRAWATGRRHCIEAIAVHEFFHILAVSHEQNRADTPSWCGTSSGISGYSEYGYWDETSVSNYCNPVWNNDAYLSQLDLSGMGDLYGLDTNDQVWFGIGDVQTYSSGHDPRLLFATARESVSGTYLPFTGDFDGDGNDDIFYYGPGGGSDSIWWYDSDRTRVSDSVTMSGTHLPISGDFDDDGRGDVFWYGVGSNSDTMWYGNANRTFTTVTPTAVNGTYIPLSADFDGDGNSDIFWYGVGSDTDYLRYGTNTRGDFDNESVDSVDGTYQPFTGDFDGDGRGDIFWYRPGSSSDYIWFGTAGRSFSSVELDVAGTYSPVAGDFDGNGTSDVIWSNDDDATDPVWLFTTTRGDYDSTHTSSILGSDSAGDDSKPFAGDLDGDGISDVLWYKAG